MKTKHIFKPALLSLAVTSAMYSGQTLAQENGANEPEVEVIAVKGIRGSLMRAQAIKQESTSIVDAVSAEDIGKLPDSSIAESLARLPGMAGERVNGRTSGISVRGFKEDFTGTSLNGRELIGIGDNRGVEYDLYPSEIMTGATIYKSADATLMVQGIGGTVDLQTVRPLAAQETLTVTGVYEKGANDSDNPDFDNTGKRLALSLVEKFADDTIGLALSYATTESPRNERQYNNSVSTVDGIAVPGFTESRAVSRELDRDTISAILQFRPTDRLDIVLDVLDIDFKEDGVFRGIYGPFSAGDDVTGTATSSSGTQVNTINQVLMNRPLFKDGTLKAYGLNVDFQINDSWSVELDVAHSESDKLEIAGESYAGVGRSGSFLPSDDVYRTFELDQNGLFYTGGQGMGFFSDPTLLQLTGPQTWGGGMANLADIFATDVLTAAGTRNHNYEDAQDGFLNQAEFQEELTTAKLEVEGYVEWGPVNKLTAGINYSDRTKEKLNKGFFAVAETFPYSEAIPEEYFLGYTDLSWVGLGNIVAHDGWAPYQDGYYTLYDGFFLETDRMGDSYVVEEEVLTLFAKFDFETEVGDFPVLGNFGFQYVDTDQSSQGAIGVSGANLRVCDDDSNSVIDERCLSDISESYSHFLPSLNVSIEVSDQTFVRLAGSKTISRARMDQMKASGFVKYDQNFDIIAIPNSIADVENYGSPWSKTAGNPRLRPYEANNFDLSVEKYFDDEGYVAVTFFYKDLVNWTRDGNTLINFTNDETNNGANYYIPELHAKTITDARAYGPTDVFYDVGDTLTPPDYGYFSFFEDGLEGEVKGTELTANLPLRILSDALDGFGIAASATFIDAELEDGNPIPGQSDETFSVTAYYEMNGFEFRVAATDRSEFSTYQRGGSNKIETATRQGMTTVDAQISYDFEDSGIEYLEGLRVSLQGTNLTDEIEQSTNDAGIVTRRLEYGASYMLNFNYSFY